MSRKQRAAWLFLTALFIFTAVGLGVWSFWASTRQANQTNKDTNQTQKVSKLPGTQLQNFTPVAKVESLQKVDTTPGNGAEAKANSTVTVLYTGALATTGVIFESNTDTGQVLTKPLTDLIQGWQEGIPGMKVGGTRRLLIPAAQAYGAQGSGKIPPNSDLVFDITLLNVQ